MIRRMIVPIAVAFVVVGTVRAGAEEPGSIAPLVDAVRRASPGLEVEVDGAHRGHATCRRGGAVVQLTLDKAGELIISAIILECGRRTESAERWTAEVNDHLDVGTLWWSAEGRLDLVHRVALSRTTVEEAAGIVDRMVERARTIGDGLRSLARS